MRRATQDYQWYLADDDSLLGLTLGFDFCAEHEEGVKPLREAFGVNLTKTPEGLEDRKIRTIPTTLEFSRFMQKPRDKRRKAYSCALLTNEPLVRKHLDKGNFTLAFWGEPYERGYRPEYDLACAWSHRAFAVLVRGEANIQRLEELYEAFKRLDIVFGSTTDGFINRRGLTFMIDSKISPETRAAVLEADRDYKRLLVTAEATGIEKRLKAAGLQWFALLPAWADGSKERVRFWLNPMEQSRYNYGWFTVEELDEWIAGHGPVVKTVCSAA